MTPRAGRILPFGEYLANARRPAPAPVFWKMADVARSLDGLEHGERGTLALVSPDAPDGASIAPGLSLAVQVVRPGESTSAHAHSFWHVYTVNSGRGAALLGEPGTRSEIEAGDVFLVPAWCEHAFENAHGDAPLVLTALQNLPEQSYLGSMARRQPDGSLEVVYGER